MDANLSSRNFSVRDNVITLHCTDAERSIRPCRQDRLVQADGTVDYMHLCTGEDPNLVQWKTKIGTFLAEVVLGRPEVRGRRKYILSALPENYALFAHKKGDRFNPRIDFYLWGCKKGYIFRSPAEFFLHAKWLLLGCPKPSRLVHDLDEELFGPSTPPDEFIDRCGCKYCAGTDQTYISTKYSNYHVSTNRTNRRANREEPREYTNARFEGLLPS